MRNYLVLAAAIFTFALTSCKEYVQPLEGQQEIPIYNLDGTKFIIDATSTFEAYIDPNFGSDALTSYGYSSGYDHLAIWSLTETGTAKQIFESIPGELNELVMTQHQMISFCEKYREELSKTTLFLTRALISFDYEYFVVEVDIKSNNRLSVFMHRYNDNPEFSENIDVHIVTPVI